MDKNTIVIPRVRPATFDSDRLQGLAERLRFSGELLEHEEAVAIASEKHTVVHGQPGTRMGGLTTALDHTRGIAPDAGDGPEGTPRKVIDAERAVSVAAELLDSLALGTVRTKSDLDLDWKIAGAVTEAVRFDGKDRVRFPVKTDVRARVTLDGIPVSGPRAGASAVFTDGDAPLRLLVATWDSVDRYDERRLVSADEAVGTLLAGRDKRGPRPSLVEVVSATLGYWAGEYAGGTDVLEPSWFVELAHAGDPKSGPGPRQLVRLPAVA